MASVSPSLGPFLQTKFSIVVNIDQPRIGVLGQDLLHRRPKQAVIGDREIGNAPAQYREAHDVIYPTKSILQPCGRSEFFRVVSVASLCGWHASSPLNPVMKSAPSSAWNARRLGVSAVA